MYIYLSLQLVALVFFALGVLVGGSLFCIVANNRIAKPNYNGHDGKGYQPLSNQGQQPTPPKSRIPPLKVPKKSAGVSDWNGSIPQSRSAPPKPLHNPHL